jgi:hypothetical protein
MTQGDEVANALSELAGSRARSYGSGGGGSGGGRAATASSADVLGDLRNTRKSRANVLPPAEPPTG